MKKVGLYVKRTSPEAGQAAREAYDWFIKKGLTVNVEKEIAEQYGINDGVDSEQLCKLSDFIVVLGGDGTFLAGARLASLEEIPIIGVNLGGLGFLTDTPKEEMFEMFELILSGQASYEERSFFDVTVHSNGKPRSHRVLNDVVIGKSALARIITLDISAGKDHVTRMLADGLIVSTPTGSTAYSMAAGGPICHPSVDAVILTPICPHLLANRPLLLPGNLPVTVELVEGGECYITLDGQVGKNFQPGDRADISRCDCKLRLFRNPKRTYYQTLRGKLRWGKR